MISGLAPCSPLGGHSVHLGGSREGVTDGRGPSPAAVFCLPAMGAHYRGKGSTSPTGVAFLQGMTGHAGWCCRGGRVHAWGTSFTCNGCRCRTRDAGSGRCALLNLHCSRVGLGSLCGVCQGVSRESRRQHRCCSTPQLQQGWPRRNPGRHLRQVPRACPRAQGGAERVPISPPIPRCFLFPYVTWGTQAAGGPRPFCAPSPPPTSR